MSHQARLFVISGPSGAGKGTLVKHLLERVPHLALSISATSRPPRLHEKNGEHYYFLAREDFLEKVCTQSFLEYALVHGNYYGTPKAEVFKKLSEGTSVVLEIDPQGAFSVKKNFPEAILIFIMPPSLEVLEDRLRKRNTDTEDSVLRRLKNAHKEIEQSNSYDTIIVNDNLEQAIDDLCRVVMSYEQETL